MQPGASSAPSLESRVESARLVHEVVGGVIQAGRVVADVNRQLGITDAVGSVARDALQTAKELNREYQLADRAVAAGKVTVQAAAVAVQKAREFDREHQVHQKVAQAAGVAAHVAVGAIHKVKEFEDNTHALRTTAEVAGKVLVGGAKLVGAGVGALARAALSRAPEDVRVTVAVSAAPADGSFPAPAASVAAPPPAGGLKRD